MLKIINIQIVPMKNNVLEISNLFLINFEYLFKNIQVNILNDLYSYNLIKNNNINISRTDIKKLIYHNILVTIYDEIIKHPGKENKIIVIPKFNFSNYEICQYCDCDKLNNLVIGLIKNMQKIMPFSLYTSNTNIFNISDVNSGEFKDELNLIQSHYRKRDKLITLEKIKKFGTKYGLSYLSKNYLEIDKIKKLLYT